MRLVGALALALVLAFGCKKRPDRAEEQKKVTTRSTDDATAPIVDEDYRFQLAWPGEGWKLLREADARHLNEDAVAGLSNDRVNAVVIVEHAPGGTLSGFADLILGNIAMEDKQVDRKDATLGGDPAVRFQVDGKIADLAMQMRGVIVAHQDHVYQMIAFAPAGTADAGDLDRAVAAFSILPGEVKRRSSTVVVEDQIGVGWRIDHGVFESAVSRLRIEPPAGWRLLVGDELERTNDDAEIGMAATDVEAYVVVIDEPIAPGEIDTYRTQRLAAAGENLELQGDAPAATIAGRSMPMTRALMAGGVQLEFVLGVFGEGPRAYQVMGWYPAKLRAQAEPALAKAFASIQLLDPAAATRLTKTLEKAPDPESSVGATYALRGGVYQDFAEGLRWRKPARGFWRLYAGQTARARNESAMLGADELVSGLGSQIIVEPASGMAGAEYHRLVIEGLTEGGFKVDRTGEGTIAGAPASYTELTQQDGGMTLRYRATTAIAGDHAIQVLVWGLAGAWPKVEELIDAVGAGLELAPGLQAIEDGGDFRDHRLGWAMKLPPSWRHTEVTPAAMKPIASIQQWRDGNKEILVVGAYAFDQQDDAWMLDLIEQMLREENAAMALEHPETKPGTLAGRDARHVVWKTAIGRVDAWLLKRDATFYAVLARDGAGATATGDLASGRFELVE